MIFQTSVSLLMEFPSAASPLENSSERPSRGSEWQIIPHNWNKITIDRPERASGSQRLLINTILGYLKPKMRQRIEAVCMRLVGNVSAAIEPQKPLNKYSICSTCVCFSSAPHKAHIDQLPLWILSRRKTTLTLTAETLWIHVCPGAEWMH